MLSQDLALYVDRQRSLGFKFRIQSILLRNFLREHLPKERSASQHTCEAYAYSFQLLLCFAASRLKLKPAKIEIEQLDPPLILAFLEYLENKRGNTARTRNARLAAINAFFRFLEYRVPSCA